jgi:hypothetical protein
MLLLIAMPAVAWANAGPPHVPGRLVGEPNGLESVAINHEWLSFDLRPLASAKSARVEAVYEIENKAEEQTLYLVFVSGPMASDSAAVVLDDQLITAVWKKVDALPSPWHAPESTPAIKGEGTLPYEGDAALDLPHFSITLPPGTHQLRVSYSAKPTSYTSGESPLLYWQMIYVLSPAREWAAFGGLDVQVQLPDNWRFACTLPLTRSGDQLSGSFGSLPADSIAITAQAPLGPMPIAALWLGRLLLLVCLVGGPVLLDRTGKRIGRRRPNEWHSLLWVFLLAVVGGIAWTATLITSLIAAFTAAFFVTDPLQHSQNYGSVYLLFALGVLCLLALPVGAIIALNGALVARRAELRAKDGSNSDALPSP